MEPIKKHVSVRPALVEITYLKALLYYRTYIRTNQHGAFDVRQVGRRSDGGLLPEFQRRPPDVGQRLRPGQYGPAHMPVEASRLA